MLKEQTIKNKEQRKYQVQKKDKLTKCQFCTLYFILCTLFVTCSLFFVNFSSVSAKASKIKNFKEIKPSQIRSYSAAAIDEESGELLFGKRENEKNPVASITKILGAYVFLSEGPDLDKTARMEQGDEAGGGRLRLPVGTKAKQKDFLYASLIGSANNSATALIRLSGLGKNSFIDKMNDLADTAGAPGAKFVDACGISPNNTGSAEELALIGRKVFANNQICNISARKKYSFKINGGKGKKTVTHTSTIVKRKISAFKTLAAKTGYLPEVGNNLITKLQNKKNGKEKIIVVTMGAKSQNSAVQDTKNIGKWVFENYKWE
ncbi:MAG: D-alanyl-D-alanine carboxypeptidase [Candidatus Moranbacteria bacterium]|nr:D-alanyl-D-alanine carboxypeptidase [Candidatus Moranbacteria bacterium]